MKEKEWVTVDINETGKLIPHHPDFDLDLYLKFLCRDIEKEFNIPIDINKNDIIDFIKSYKKGE